MKETGYFNFFPLVGFLGILILIFWRVLFLKKAGIRVSSKSRKKNKVNLFLFPVFGIIFLTWLFEIAKPAFYCSFSFLPEFLTKCFFESIFLKVTGAVFIVISLILLLTTLIHFQTSLRFGLDENNQGKMVASGIFSFSRNPFFLSLDVYFFGIALIFPNLFFIGFAIFAFTGIHFFILKEEKFLRKVYGKEYDEYAEKAGRYI